MRVDNNPGARLGEQMDAALYLNHPYGRPVIGWRQEIEQLDREDALAFYRRFYTPNNAILVVAGDVTRRGGAARWREETYGKVPRVADDQAARFARRSRCRKRRAPSRSPIRASPSRALSRYYLVPSSTTARPGESEALDVLTHILGRGSNSRLYQTLVVEKGVAVNAGASYDGTALDNTRLSVYATPKPETTPAATRSRRSTPCSPTSSRTA